MGEWSEMYVRTGDPRQMSRPDMTRYSTDGVSRGQHDGVTEKIGD